MNNIFAQQKVPVIILLIYLVLVNLTGYISFILETSFTEFVINYFSFFLFVFFLRGISYVNFKMNITWSKKDIVFLSSQSLFISSSILGLMFIITSVNNEIFYLLFIIPILICLYILIGDDMNNKKTSLK